MLSNGMTDWIEVYRPVLGEEIAGLVWMPITADTPKLASELQMASYSFSGAAFVRFTNQDAINLSWRQVEDRFVLATAQDAAWGAHSLDRIQAAGDLWIGLIGSSLTSVELFTLPDDEHRRVVGVKHRTTNGSFWVGTGGKDFIGDQDDLWVGVDREPSNYSELVSLGVVEPEAR
ncbi:hypothetical protein O3U67_12245 [Brevundimonas diminuta]|uniref:hypothetical protein n=1 Tax=Brevundimonas diminuta TaxID=293 RepID=UPI0022B03D6A|nr:hypothetical protein [Brevundimonas diminuta]MCZ4108855.1 hypothetical protein [Brevundimonas diminuta]